ncbi:hypothetical protein [Thauera aromatica]|nr:hypothetical protein [Thauera aromatica]
MYKIVLFRRGESIRERARRGFRSAGIGGRDLAEAMAIRRGRG